MKFLEQIKQLFCFHKWEVYEKRELFPKDYLRQKRPDLADFVDTFVPSRRRYKIPIGIKYVLRCEKCGMIHFKIDDYRYHR
jgi:hypothetical protein